MDSSNLSQNAKSHQRSAFDNITSVMVITQLKADLVASETEAEEGESLRCGVFYVTLS